MGNDEALRMEGFFAACGLPSVPESCPRGELPHGSVTSACLMEQRSKACRGFSTASASLPGISRSITARAPGKSSRRSLRPATATKRARCRAASVLPPASSASRHLHPPSLPVALTTALCLDSVPPCAVPCSQPDQSAFPTDPPLHRRKALPILSRSMAARKQAREIKKKLRPSSLPSIPSFLSGRMACLISNSHQTTPGTSDPT